MMLALQVSLYIFITIQISVLSVKRQQNLTKLIGVDHLFLGDIRLEASCLRSLELGKASLFQDWSISWDWLGWVDTRVGRALGFFVSQVLGGQALFLFSLEGAFSGLDSQSLEELLSHWFSNEGFELVFGDQGSDEFNKFLLLVNDLEVSVGIFKIDVGDTILKVLGWFVKEESEGVDHLFLFFFQGAISLLN